MCTEECYLQSEKYLSFFYKGEFLDFNSTFQPNTTPDEEESLLPERRV